MLPYGLYDSGFNRINYKATIRVLDKTSKLSMADISTLFKMKF